MVSLELQKLNDVLKTNDELTKEVHETLNNPKYKNDSNIRFILMEKLSDLQNNLDQIIQNRISFKNSKLTGLMIGMAVLFAEMVKVVIELMIKESNAITTVIAYAVPILFLFVLYIVTEHTP